MILLMRINLKPVVNLLQNRTLKSIEHQRRKIKGVILKVSDQVMMQFRCKKCDWLEIWWLNSSLSVKLINIVIIRNVPRHRYLCKSCQLTRKKWLGWKGDILWQTRYKALNKGWTRFWHFIVFQEMIPLTISLSQI